MIYWLSHGIGDQDVELKLGEGCIICDWGSDSCEYFGVRIGKVEVGFSAVRLCCSSS
jgi:hypothetical protein